jgi:acyl-coenzyme A thioesterase PaaI-like protein
MTNIDFEAIKERAKKSSIPYVGMSGLRLEIAEERHCRMVMPLTETHVNHVGVAYAGSLFVLGEVFTAYILSCTYGDAWVPIAAKDEIEFVKPCREDMVVDFSLTQEEADEMIKPVLERGKGRITLKYPIQSAGGEVVANMTAVVYLLPKGGTL